MNYTYEEKPELDVIIRIDENGLVCSIPMDEANADYQEYLNPSEPKTK
jgi:Tfp pilus assembly PilM family ATPase